jgi:hypothetical protein
LSKLHPLLAKVGETVRTFFGVGRDYLGSLIGVESSSGRLPAWADATSVAP